MDNRTLARLSLFPVTENVLRGIVARFAWTVAQTKTGGVKAVGTGEHAGRTLYGARARSALTAKTPKPAKAAPPPKAVKPTVDETHAHVTAHTQEMLKDPAVVKALAERLKGHSLAEMKALRDKLGFGGSGGKAAIADAIVKQQGGAKVGRAKKGAAAPAKSPESAKPAGAAPAGASAAKPSGVNPYREVLGAIEEMLRGKDRTAMMSIPVMRRQLAERGVPREEQDRAIKHMIAFEEGEHLFGHRHNSVAELPRDEQDELLHWGPDSFVGLALRHGKTGPLESLADEHDRTQAEAAKAAGMHASEHLAAARANPALWDDPAHQQKLHAALGRLAPADLAAALKAHAAPAGAPAGAKGSPVGPAAAKGPAVNPYRAVLKGMHALQSDLDRGGVASIPELRPILDKQGISRADQDKAILEMAGHGVALHRHNSLADLTDRERDALVHDGKGNHFIAVALRDGGQHGVEALADEHDRANAPAPAPKPAKAPAPKASPKPAPAGEAAHHAETAAEVKGLYDRAADSSPAQVDALLKRLAPRSKAALVHAAKAIDLLGMEAKPKDTILERIGRRIMERQGTKKRAEMIDRPTVPDRPEPARAGADPESRVARALLEAHDARDDDGVLHDVREALPDLSRAEVDRHVKALRKKGLIRLRQTEVDPVHRAAGIEEEGERLGNYQVPDRAALGRHAGGAAKGEEPPTEDKHGSDGPAKVYHYAPDDEGKNLPNADAMLKDVWAEHRKLRPGEMLDIADLHDVLAAKHPGLTVPRLHKQLLAWQNDGKLGLMTNTGPEYVPAAKLAKHMSVQAGTANMGDRVKSWINFAGKKPPE